MNSMEDVRSVPIKYFYTIGDVCRLTGTKPHILRYWESQFKLLRPARRYSGHRKYTQRDIDLISQIKFLILEKRYTLAGAKREINRQVNFKAKEDNRNPQTIAQALPLLKELKKEVEDCLSLLQSEPAQQQFAGLKL